MSVLKPKILISNLMMLKEKDRFERLMTDAGAEPVWAKVDQFLTEEACLGYAGEVDAWAAGDDQITRRVLQAFRPRLRGIAKWGTGIDSIDLVAAKEMDVPVMNTPGAFSEAVSEVALGYMLMLSRHLGMVDRAVRSGKWPKPMGTGLFEKTVGIVGFGAIGQGIAQRAVAFGMRVQAFDPPMQHLGSHAGVNLVDLDDLLKSSDFVCIACSLTPENVHLINDAALALMKTSSYLINVARGPVVDERALTQALVEGHLAGAGLDVFEDEPLPASSVLRDMDNVVLGSHNANNLQSAVEFVHSNTMKNLLGLVGAA